jgi:hypothetical protein
MSKSRQRKPGISSKKLIYRGGCAAPRAKGNKMKDILISASVYAALHAAFHAGLPAAWYARDYPSA